MLQNKNVEPAINLYKSLMRSGVKLRIKNGSIFSVLVNESLPIQADPVWNLARDKNVAPVDPSTPVSTDNLADVSTTIAERCVATAGSYTVINNESTVKHSSEMATAAKLVSDSIARSVNFAKNVINPIVETVVKDAKTAKANVVMNEADNTAIALYKKADIYKEDELLEMIENNAQPQPQFTVNKVLLDKLFKDIDIDLFCQVSKTGFESVDSKLKSTITRENELGYSDVVLNYMDDYNVNLPYTGPNSKPFGDHRALAYYLFINGTLADKHPEVDVNDLSIEYINELRVLRNHMAYSVKRQLAQLDRLANEELLFYRELSVNNTIAVNALAYRKVVGDDERITPAVVKEAYTRGVMSATEFTTNLTTFIEGAAFKSTAKMGVDNVKIVTAINRAVRSSINYQLQELVSTDEELTDVLPRYVEALKKEGDWVIDMPLDLYVAKLVCESICPRTDTYKILTMIKHERRKDPDISISDAANKSYSELITQMWMNNIEVVCSKD